VEQAALTQGCTGIAAFGQPSPLQQKLTALASSSLERQACADIGFPLLEAHVDAVLPPVRQYAVGLRKSLDRPFLGGSACGCGGAGAPCPDCNKTNPADPDDVPAMPAGFTPDLS
jgi:hypothetical protein